jgi:hypothetical protein
VAISDMQRHGELEVRKEGQRIVAMRMVAKAGADPVKLKRADRGATREQIEASTYEPVQVEFGDPTSNPTPYVVTQRPTVTVPSTPGLDKYLQARRIKSLLTEDNPFITIEFREDPIAEEAIALKQALTSIAGGTITNGGAE